MKKLITILMMASLPSMAITLNEAKDTLTKHGIAMPTVLVGNDKISDILDIYGYSSGGITHSFSQGEMFLNGEDDSNFFYNKNFGYNNPQYITMYNVIYHPGGALGGAGTFIGGNFGTAGVMTMDTSINGNTQQMWTEDYVAQTQRFIDQTGLMTGDDDILGSIGGSIGAIILDKANSIKPIVETMGRQLAASALGKDARAACANQVEFTLVDPICTAIGSEFADIANSIEPYSNIISEDNVVYQGDTWYRDFDAVPWWGSTDADTRLGIYRLRKADGSWRMETRATGSYIRGWNEANTSTGHGWSPEVNHATVYNDNLDDIGDLADVLITLDGETFGDILN